MLMRDTVLILALGALLPQAHAGRDDYFKCVAADGAVSYSVERCPKGDRQSIVRVDAAPESLGVAQAAQPNRATPAAVSASAWQPAPSASPTRGRLVVYTRSTCGYCKQAKQYMATHRIGYTEIDIERSPGGMADYKRFGARGVPFFVAGGKTMTGFSPDGLRDLLGL
jgi:glutaredoxin